MKRKVLLLFISVIILSFLVACGEQVNRKPDKPTNTAMLLIDSIRDNNYEEFTKLFIEEKKNVVSEEMLKKFNKLSSNGCDIDLYDVLTYSNGEILLVRLTAEKVKGEYKVLDVVEIPEEMKKLFKKQ